MSKNRKTIILETLMFLGVIAVAVALGFIVNQVVDNLFDSSADKLINIPSWQEQEFIKEITQLAEPDILESIYVSCGEKDDYLFYITIKPDQRYEKKVNQLIRSMKKYLKQKSRKNTTPPLKLRKAGFMVKYSGGDNEEIVIHCWRFACFWRQEKTRFPK